eukprot:3541397-Heterocapsa_arctica.AAC.1
MFGSVVSGKSNDRRILSWICPFGAVFEGGINLILDAVYPFYDLQECGKSWGTTSGNGLANAEKQ